VGRVGIAAMREPAFVLAPAEPAATSDAAPKRPAATAARADFRLYDIERGNQDRDTIPSLT